MQPSTRKHFTPFFSAAEEAAAAAVNARVNEGGHMHAKCGHIVQTRDAPQPYKVVFEHEDRPNTEQVCATSREGQAIIRRNTPTPASPSTMRNQKACAV
jgi:hypothetical protein